MNTDRVKVFHRADCNAITRCIAHHFEFDFFPAGDASFHQDLADRRFLDAAMGDLLQFFLGIGNTAARTA